MPRENLNPFVIAHRLCEPSFSLVLLESQNVSLALLYQVDAPPMRLRATDRQIHASTHPSVPPGCKKLTPTARETAIMLAKKKPRVQSAGKFLPSKNMN